MKKVNRISLVSFLVLGISFIVIRYALFAMHGMKQLPLVLFLLIVMELIVLSFMRVKIVFLVSAISYPLGFVIGFLFQTNGLDVGGGAINNLWVIWICTVLVMIVVSVIAELINRRKASNNILSLN